MENHYIRTTNNEQLRVILDVVSGSRAYGLHRPDSDYDYRGIFIPPAHKLLGFGMRETVSKQGEDATYHSLKKYLQLALKANPNILEWLWVDSPNVSKEGQELIDNRRRFLSQLVHVTFGGYAMSHMKKMEASQGKSSGYAMHGERDASTDPASVAVNFDCKNAMHLIRLLLCGVELLKNGNFIVKQTEHAPVLRDIRDGHYSIESVLTLAHGLFTKMDDALAETRLPKKPDSIWAEDFLVRIYHAEVLRTIKDPE